MTKKVRSMQGHRTNFLRNKKVRDPSSNSGSNWEFQVKSQTNYKKHGIDFIQAQELWEDPQRLEIPAKTTDEPRVILIGKVQGKRWSAIFTQRGQKTRIISVRRAREKEVVLYES